MGGKHESTEANGVEEASSARKANPWTIISEERIQKLNEWKAIPQKQRGTGEPRCALRENRHNLQAEHLIANQERST